MAGSAAAVPWDFSLLYSTDDVFFLEALEFAPLSLKTTVSVFFFDNLEALLSLACDNFDALLSLC